MLECPPTSHTRQLSASKPVRFSVSGDCGQQVEEVVNDVLSGVGIDGHRDKSVEGVSCHVRIWESKLALCREPGSVIEYEPRSPREKP